MESSLIMPKCSQESEIPKQKEKNPQEMLYPQLQFYVLLYHELKLIISEYRLCYFFGYLFPFLQASLSHSNNLQLDFPKWTNPANPVENECCSAKTHCVHQCVKINCCFHFPVALLMVITIYLIVLSH